MRKIIKIFLIVTIIIAGSVGAGYFSSKSINKNQNPAIQIAHAQQQQQIPGSTTIIQSTPNGGNVYGWMWSSNIGWISMNCSTGGTNSSNICSSANGNYGVNLEPKDSSDNQNLKGYAWSSNIGWIKFDGGLTGPNNNSVGAKILSNNKVTGWARACSVFQSGCGGALKTQAELGGWDGWINFPNSGVCGTGLNCVNKTDYTNHGKLSGYAWSSDVLGWIDTSNVYIESAITPALCALTGAINVGQPLPCLFSSTCQNPPCQACANPPCGEDIDGGWNTIDCVDNDGNQMACPLDLPTVTLTPDTDPVVSGNSTTLRWSGLNLLPGADNCIAKGAWSGTKTSPTGSQSTGPITDTSVYWIKCASQNYPGLYSDWAEAIVNIAGQDACTNIDGTQTNLTSLNLLANIDGSCYCAPGYEWQKINGVSQPNTVCVSPGQQTPTTPGKKHWWEF